jgi:hypothetical protein
MSKLHFCAIRKASLCSSGTVANSKGANGVPSSHSIGCSKDISSPLMAASRAASHALLRCLLGKTEVDCARPEIAGDCRCAAGVGATPLAVDGTCSTEPS